MFKFPDWCYSKLPPTAKPWLIFWAIWFITLCFLSANPAPNIGNGLFNIPHSDKILHFVYFMIGGFCCANFLNLQLQLPWKKIILLTLLVGAIIGGIDEYHQTLTIGRQGKSLGDWVADVLGTIAGAYYCYFMWKRIKEKHALKI